MDHLVIVSHDHAPVIVLHPWFNVDVQTWVEDVRVMPPHDAAPGAFLAGVLDEFAPRDATIATGKMLWAQTLLALQHAAPTARFITADNTMMDRMRSIKDAGELELMQRAATIADVALARDDHAYACRHDRAGRGDRGRVSDSARRRRRPVVPAGIIAVGNGSDPRRHIFTRNTDLALEPE